ncbi:TadE family type IV pilus minor pilin [Pseudolysinimonas sp.]|uniref:TadE family type IV pilus minor pilin n=1 Tax=Pseudolysinimonas sp. TaxID=2680009 RepID=UPI00286AE9BD|nr:TadE family type IV pilus minor pilin [Pseudolysinimonas sp.]
MTRRRLRFVADRGSATAEFALAFPAVLGVVALLLGGVQVVGLQVRAQDAAADAARGLGRGDSAAAVAARLERQVAGASLSSWVDGDLRCVRVEVAPAGAAALLGLRARADACALDDAR